MLELQSKYNGRKCWIFRKNIMAYCWSFRTNIIAHNAGASEGLYWPNAITFSNNHEEDFISNYWAFTKLVIVKTNVIFVIIIVIFDIVVVAVIFVRNATTKHKTKTCQTPVQSPVPCSIVAFLRKYRQRSPITNAVCLYMNKYVCPPLAVAALRISGLPLVPPSRLLTAVTNQISGFCHLARQFFCLYSFFLILALLLTLESCLFTLCNKAAAMAPTAGGNYRSAVVER